MPSPIMTLKSAQGNSDRPLVCTPGKQDGKKLSVGKSGYCPDFDGFSKSIINIYLVIKVKR